MRVFLAAVQEARIAGTIPDDLAAASFVLGSFYYFRSARARAAFNPHRYRDFLLDSGAHTFTNANTSSKEASYAKGYGINWKEYIREYAHFVKDFKIQKYFELDIDEVIGYERVKYYRDMLEDLVGWPSIPVYHIGRTYDDFAKECENHPYVAYGTNAGEGIKNNDNVKKICDIAHDKGSKIHLLGISNPGLFGKNGIVAESCDSSTWALDGVFGKRVVLNLESNDPKNFYSYIRLGRAQQLRPFAEKRFSFSLWAKIARWCAQHIDPIWDEDSHDFPHVDEDDMTDDELCERYRNIKNPPAK